MTLQTDNMRESSVLTNELMMRVLQVESPELFDGSDKEPVEVTDYKRKKWEICPYGTCVFPDELYITYQTRGGKSVRRQYDEFGMPEILDALDEWDKQHGKAVENLG